MVASQLDFRHCCYEGIVVTIETDDMNIMFLFLTIFKLSHCITTATEHGVGLLYYHISCIKCSGYDFICCSIGAILFKSSVYCRVAGIPLELLQIPMS